MMKKLCLALLLIGGHFDCAAMDVENQPAVVQPEKKFYFLIPKPMNEDSNNPSLTIAERQHQDNLLFDSCTRTLPSLEQGLNVTEYPHMGWFLEFPGDFLQKIFADESVIKWLMKNRDISTSFNKFVETHLINNVKTGCVGNHKLEIFDRTGKFSASPKYKATNTMEKKNFNYTLEGEYPLHMGRCLEKGSGSLKPVYGYNNSTKFVIDYLRDESVIQIEETDTTTATCIVYLCPANREFQSYFANSDVYKGFYKIENFKHHQISSLPDSNFFVEENVKFALKNSFFDYIKNIACSGANDEFLRAFYNRHGIILNLKKNNLDYIRRSNNKGGLSVTWGQEGPGQPLLYMEPTTRKVSLEECTLAKFIDHPVKLCRAKNLYLSLIITHDQYFLNGEPASVIDAETILKLWEV